MRSTGAGHWAKQWPVAFLPFSRLFYNSFFFFSIFYIFVTFTFLGATCRCFEVFWIFLLGCRGLRHAVVLACFQRF